MLRQKCRSIAVWMSVLHYSICLLASFLGTICNACSSNQSLAVDAVETVRMDDVYISSAASGTLSKAMQMECEKFASWSVLSCDSHWKWIKQRPWAGKPEFWFLNSRLNLFNIVRARRHDCLSLMSSTTLRHASDIPNIPSSNTPDGRCTAPDHRLASAFPDKTQPTIPRPILKAKWLYESFEFLPSLTSSNCELHHFARARLQLWLQDTMQINWCHLCTSDSGFKKLRTVGSAMFGTLLRSTRNFFPRKPSLQVGQVKSSQVKHLRLETTCTGPQVSCASWFARRTATDWFRHNFPTSCTSASQRDCAFNFIFSGGEQGGCSLVRKPCAECKRMVSGGSCTSSAFFLSYGIAWDFCKLNSLTSIDFANVC